MTLTNMNVFEVVGLVGSVIGASMLSNIVVEIRKRVQSNSRLKFWAILIGYLVINAVRLIMRSLHWFTPDENILVDTLLQASITAYLIYYAHTIYLK